MSAARSRLKSLLVLCGAAIILAACGGGAGSSVRVQDSADIDTAPALQPLETIYTLGTGDRVRVIVFGEDNLSGEFQIDGDGIVSLPLIGEVAAGGRTVREFQTAVAESLRDGYLNDPKVSVEVLNYRPFYILGEVEEGGEYPYQSGMTVLNAIAIAGGHTYRADTDRVIVTHKGSSSPIQYPVSAEVKVLPGDVIEVPERFF